MRTPNVARGSVRRPLVTAGILLGIGLGGFVDGIVFHQILQWHNMLSARIPPVDLVSVGSVHNPYVRDSIERDRQLVYAA